MTSEPAPWEGESTSSGFDERPEAYVGAAFVGGLVLALLLKRLGPDDD